MEIAQTIAAANRVLSHLDNCIWQKVAAKNVEKMAPRAVGAQGKDAIETMVYLSFAESYKSKIELAQQRDPFPASIDTFSNGKICRDDKHSPISDLKMSKVQQKCKSLFTERSKRSRRSSKFEPDISSKMLAKQRGQNEAKKPQFFISLNNEQAQLDVFEQKMRSAENARLNQETKKKRQDEQMIKARSIQNNNKQKLIKQNKPFTFDYEGDCCGINALKLPSEALRKMKETLKNGQVVSTDRNTFGPTAVVNEKMKEREERASNKTIVEKPTFSEKQLTLAAVLDDESKISEGIKITELRGGNNTVTFEHKAKRSEGLKMYRLKDYKNLTREKSFQDYGLKTITHKSTLLDLSASQNRQDQSLKTIQHPRVAAKSSGKSQPMIKATQTHNVLQSALGRGLPFIRTKGLKFYDIGIGSGYKTLDFNLSSSEKKKSRAKSSRINIGDITLYEQIFH